MSLKDKDFVFHVTFLLISLCSLLLFLRFLRSREKFFSEYEHLTQNDPYNKVVGSFMSAVGLSNLSSHGVYLTSEKNRPNNDIRKRKPRIGSNTSGVTTTRT